ncbi:MAG: methionyl-tRNA formyltransferase [Pseudomonadota bacterium]
MLRVIFMGTPDFSVPTLSEILSAGHEVAAVYSQPPRPAGRGQAERPSPVHAFAEHAGLTVRTPTSLKTADAQADFAALEADVAVVVAYGLILPQPILDAPRDGCFNLHASALPRWRGAAPIQRAIMAGDQTTAVMVMRMDAGLDTGPVCLGEHVAIGPNETAGGLHDALMTRGADLMGRALAALERGSLDCKPQADAGVTYAAKIDKAEAAIDFTRAAGDVHNHIRGLSPFPGAWFPNPEKPAERIKVLASALADGDGDGAPGEVLAADGLVVATGDGAIRLKTLQRAGKSAMPAEAFLRGTALMPGTVLPSAARD